MDIIYRYRKSILIFIFFIAIALRFYGAATVPYNWDEMINVRAAKEISFSSTHPKVPLINTKPEGILLEMYIVKLSWDIFGESYLSSRLPSLIIGLLLIVLVYFFVESTFGVYSALLICTLIALSPLCIILSRNADLTIANVSLSFLSLCLMYKAVVSSDSKLFLLNGALIGLGYLVKESMVFMIPICIIFLWMVPQYRFWLKNIYLWISFVIALCIMMPFVWLSLSPEAQRFSFVYNEVILGPSLNGVGLYMAELILLIVKVFNNHFFHYLASSVDPEYPPVHFVLGLLILIAAFKYLKDKRPFVKLLLITFFFNFILFSFLRCKNYVVKNVWSLASLEWGIMGFVPGLILAADMLANFFSHKSCYRKGLFMVLIMFMFFRGWDVASFPLNCHPPKRDRCIEQLLYDDEKRGNVHNYLGKPLYGEVNYYLKEGEGEIAKDILTKIYENTDNRPEYKAKAAFELVNIFIEEKKYKKAVPYMTYLSAHGYSDKALSKLEEKDRFEVILKEGLTSKGR